MPVHNADIAAVFEEIADLLEIRGDNPFRIRACRKSVPTVGEFSRDLKTLVDQGQARRGWLSPDDVLNGRTHAALKPLIKRTMQR